MEKQCSSCGVSKDTSEFYLNKNTKDGRQYCCKSCSKLNVLKYRPIKGKKRKRTEAEKKQQKREWDKQYRKNHPGKVRANKRKYDKRVQQATPLWLSSEDQGKIDDIYKYCPSGYHVDHIVPINGKNVSGLHVPWNLQYLKAEENIKKGNKY